MRTDPKLVEQFSERAQAAAAVVRTVESLADAFEYAVSVCRDKEACQVLASGCEHPLSGPAAELCGLKQWEKLIAAPELEQKDLEILTEMCRQAGIGLIQTGIAEYAGGMDVGFTRADAGIAETGTIVLRCPGEDLRLATMISEIHIAVIRAEDIYPDAYAVEDMLTGFFSSSPDYTAFITGPSRTADIERVLSLGVHGPLELHVLILMEPDRE